MSRRVPLVVLPAVAAALAVSVTLLAPSPPAPVVTSAEMAAPPAPAHRILITGDSVTQGSTGDYTWRFRLWRKLKRTAPDQVAFVGRKTDLWDNIAKRQGSTRYAVAFGGRRHAAVWGTALARQKREIAEEVSATRPSVLVVMLGQNDLVSGGWSPADVADSMRAYLTRARSARPGLDVVVAEPLTRHSFEKDKTILRRKAARTAALLADLVAELDTPVERVVLARTLTGWRPRPHTYDGVHPNATGETVIAQRVSEALAGLGVGTRSPNVVARVRMPVRAPRPRVTVEGSSATLTWGRRSSGATSMWVEVRRPGASVWSRVGGPVGIAAGNRYRFQGLSRGEHAFRLVARKGVDTGRPGPVVRRDVG